MEHPHVDGYHDLPTGGHGDETAAVTESERISRSQRCRVRAEPCRLRAAVSRVDPQWHAHPGLIGAQRLPAPKQPRRKTPAGRQSRQPEHVPRTGPGIHLQIQDELARLPAQVVMSRPRVIRHLLLVTYRRPEGFNARPDC